MPLVVDVESTDYSLGGIIDYASEYISGTDDDFADEYTLIDENDIDEYIDDIREGIRNIQSEVDTLSDTYEAAQNLYDYLRSGTSASNEEILQMIAYALAPKADAANDEGSDACESREYEQTYYDHGGSWIFLVPDTTVQNTTVSEIDDNICPMLEVMQLAADADYEEAITNLILDTKELADLFDSDGDSDTGSSLYQLREAFGSYDLQPGEADVESLIGLLYGAMDTITASTARDIIAKVNDIYTLVQNIEFVQVQLTASVLEGNAPLIVRFDVLGTEDPSGLTVEDSQIEWDLYGTGDWVGNESGLRSFSDFFVGTIGSDYIGDATSAVYEEAGTYRVRVRVKSQSSEVAAGIATVTINVGAPKSILILEATAGGETTVLTDTSTFPAIDKSTYKVTMAEAEEGITFDASQSTDGDGNSAGLIFAEWDFGDNEVESGEWSQYNSITHQYGEEGTYDVSLTITDETGIEDRKYFKLYVASPAARLTAFPESGEVGTSFKFDGTGSSTDIGTIVSYQWSATVNGEAYDLSNTSGSSITETLTTPGVYTVTLTVTDSSGIDDNTSVEVLVESQTPEAIFEAEIPNSNQPATVELDATDSYDPDEDDTISYEWDFDGTEDEDYLILDGDSSSSEVTVQYLAVDEYSVTLEVCDQHEDELQKCDEMTQIIQIDSILDVDLEIEGENARHLDDNGESDVEFYAYSEIATGFEMDYGDGETDFTESITRGQSIFTHTYESAGVFYATLTAYDDDSKTNSITRRVYVAAGDSPIAVMNVTADGEDIGFGDSLTGTVNTLFAFDATDSVNIDGSNNNLSYSWNFGDGTTASQNNVTHRFDEHATYEVTLTVKDKDDTSVTDETTVSITIQGLDPEIHGISITPQADTLETPLKVNVEVDTIDEDGEITYVKGWYYDLEDSATELGTVIAQSTSFTITVNTKGEEGEEVEYGFAAEVTDDDNNTVSSFDELSEDSIPTLEVINGPNDSPVAAFNVDRSSVYIGEEVTFSSTSYDPDGEIVAYWWDLEGDGFYNNEEQEEDYLTYEFSSIYTDGVEVQLKVEDDSGATAVSDTVTIYVDAVTDPPEAKFLANVSGLTVEFENNSDIDTENGAEFEGIYWDFDLSSDSDGNGITDDDFDSFDEVAEYEYEDFGVYEVKMTIVDTTGQSDTVTQEINVIETKEPVAGFTYETDYKVVEFKNTTETDEDNDVDVRSYSWDFDLDTDSDGDGEEDNDTDSDEKNPEYEYEEYGDYEVSLTVVDTYGKEDSVENTVEVEDPMANVEALLTAVPSPNELGQVVADEDPMEVTFYYGAEGGSGDYTFEFDKNIFYDTEGDSIRDNDADYINDTAGSWKTTFYESYGKIVVKLTVTDNETGATDVATLQVVYEGMDGSANLFNATPGEMALLIISALLTAIFGVTLAFNYKPISTKTYGRKY